MVTLRFSCALIVHVLLDGAILSMQTESELLAWAVIAHRLPAGFALIMVAQSAPSPKRVAWIFAALMIGATSVGYLYGPSLLTLLPHEGPAVMEALVIGVLLHVAFVPHSHSTEDSCAGQHHHEHGHHEHGHHEHGHHEHGHHEHGHHEHGHHEHGHHEHGHHEHGHHEHGHHEHHHDEISQSYPNHGHAAHLHKPSHEGRATYRKLSDREWAAFGSLFGALSLIAMSYLGHDHEHEHGAIESSVPTFLETFGVLVLESAPALLLGYALAGVIPFLLTPARTTALGRGNSVMQSLRGVAFGLPLPVCSCGVLPLYESLIRRGAPPVAAIAFLLRRLSLVWMQHCYRFHCWVHL